MTASRGTEGGDAETPPSSSDGGGGVWSQRRVAALVGVAGRAASRERTLLIPRAQAQALKQATRHQGCRGAGHWLGSGHRRLLLQ